MWRRTRRLALALLLTSLGGLAVAEPIDVAAQVAASGADPARTTLLIERLSDGQVWISGPVRADRRFSPASTSKIPHMLIALEYGLATPETVFPWDGTLRGRRVLNRDQTLASAARISAVWVFQDIARRAGPETLSEALRAFGYGNASTGGADRLTTYWLDGTLRISAREQVAFLTRLASGTLPLRLETLSAARDILVTDRGEGWVLRAKTGWFHDPTAMDIGWYVGWLECGSDIFVFALNMDLPDTRTLHRREATTRAVLRDIGAFDCR
ncbi:MAG: penicillin-binding transpeptidase domain-containing protein [Shimia sp.]